VRVIVAAKEVANHYAHVESDPEPDSDCDCDSDTDTDTDAERAGGATAVEEDRGKYASSQILTLPHTPVPHASSLTTQAFLDPPRHRHDIVPPS
jgi:hypothetical protein